MKISRIKIENFRSIKSSEFNCSDFNIYVGQNNVGKTNFFEAIDWFYKGSSARQPIGSLYYKRDSTQEMYVEVEFVNAQHGAGNMRNEVNRTKMQNVLGEHDAITVRRSSANEKKRIIEVNGEIIEKLPTGFDKAFNDFLPKFEYIHTKQYFDEVAKFTKKTPVGIMLSSVLEEILQENQKYADFKEKFTELFDGDDSEVRAEFEALGTSVKVHLEKQFTDCTKVTFEVLSPEFEDLLKNFETIVDDGVETYAHEKGDGMQRALMLAIIQAYAEYRKQKEDAGKSFLFFIDEAELHLHPTAQRKLKEVLLELSRDLDQVFINTHSSVFVADDHARQLIHKVEKNEGKTKFDLVDELDKPYVVYELLGGSPADLLLPRNFLIVEGPSEFELITRAIKRFYNEAPAIQVISAEGDTHQAKRSINAIKKAYSPLDVSMFQNRVVVLLDNPTEKAQVGFNAFLNEFSSLQQNGQIHVLRVGALEEYYPDNGDWRKTTEEASRMKGSQKIKLAKWVGDNITKEQFEEMPIILKALNLAWELAY
ncbi:MAG: ATP-binding protein [PVC group bacterium]|nr:ATP-binding protein [PVC group bacterium]